MVDESDGVIRRLGTRVEFQSANPCIPRLKIAFRGRADQPTINRSERRVCA